MWLKATESEICLPARYCSIEARDRGHVAAPDGVFVSRSAGDSVVTAVEKVFDGRRVPIIGVFVPSERNGFVVT